MRPDYLIIGPDPRRCKPANPGGQLTAMRGLSQYADEMGLNLEFIDTLQGSFPLPSIPIRCLKSVGRLLQLVWRLIFRRPLKGVLVFSAGPGSFVERGILMLIVRVVGLSGVICLRSGHLLPLLGGIILL